MKCHEYQDHQLALVGTLLLLADRHDTECELDDCLLLNGAIRDFAYKLRGIARQSEGHPSADVFPAEGAIGNCKHSEDER
jgi:hypothetical protein